jgi:SLT domain-containing protein
MEGVFKRFVKVSTPVKFASDLVQHVPVYIAQHMAAWVKKQLQEMADPGGSGVARWRPYVLRALKMLGLSESLVGKVLRQIQTESGGNPKAMGGTDGLSDGHAEGLMQVKPPTFNAYKLQGHGNIWNGFDNLLAGLNYAKHRYGNSLYFLGQGHGYANGGFVTNHGLYELAESNRPEAIIPTDITRRDRAYQLLGQLMTRFRADDPRISTLGSDTGNLKNVEKKMDTMIGLLSELLGSGNATVQAIKNQGSLDVKRLYKRQALDASMRAFS